MGGKENEKEKQEQVSIDIRTILRENRLLTRTIQIHDEALGFDLANHRPLFLFSKSNSFNCNS